MKQTDTKSPWAWIPTVYVAEGVPYCAVNTLTILLYYQLGISKTQLAFLTGWLYLPWVIKPFWSPFVDIIGSKRGWTIAMQALIGVCFAAIAFFLTTSSFLATTLACFWLTAFFSATHDIAADGYYMLALEPHEQAAFVGVRSTFYRIASVIGQGGLVLLAATIDMHTGSPSAAWTTVFGILSVFFLLLALFHSRTMPRVAADAPRHVGGVASILKDFASTFVTFFRKPHFLTAVAFILVYRLPEAVCIKMVQPFLIDPVDAGGLGLSLAQIGVANGTVGVIALLAGGILGGLAIARSGLSRWLWPMACALTLPCMLYCFLAIWQPQSFALVTAAIAVEQFGYGFGFTAYMLYLIYFSQGENSTSHYAFCTAFMALGMMLPGMAAGWVAETLASHFGQTGGYVAFFWFVMLCCLATFAVTAAVRIDPAFGRKKEVAAAEA